MVVMNRWRDIWPNCFMTEPRPTFIAALQESAPVQVLGRLHDQAIHAHQRQASEKRQGTKSREVGHPPVQE